MKALTNQLSKILWLKLFILILSVVELQGQTYTVTNTGSGGNEWLSTCGNATPFTAGSFAEGLRQLNMGLATKIVFGVTGTIDLSARNTIQLCANNVTIEGTPGVIILGNNWADFLLWTGNNDTIRNIEIRARVLLDGADGNYISGCNINHGIQDGDGIELRNSASNNQLLNNTFTYTGASSPTRMGIEINSGSSGNTISGNNVSGFIHNIRMVSEAGGPDMVGNSITNNTASNPALGGHNLYLSDIGGFGPRNTVVSGNTFIGANQSNVYFRNLETGHGNTLTNNTARGSTNNSGFYIENSPGTLIQGNIAYDNSQNGIEIHGSSNCTVTNNQFYDNGSSGILLADNSASNTITNNTITNNDNIGVEIMSGANTNTIHNNTISGNGSDGVNVLGSTSTGNSIRQNIISCNTGMGINLNYGADEGNAGNESPEIYMPALTANHIEGTAGPNQTIDFYYTPASCPRDCDNTLKREGAVYITSVTSDGSGNWSLDMAFTGTVTLTATDASSNTSEFSTCFTPSCVTPAVAAGSDQSLCNVTTTNLGGNTPGSGDNGNWTIVTTTMSPSPTIASSSSATSALNGLSEGTVTLRWTITSGACSNQDDVIITLTTVSASVGSDQNLCNATSTSVTGNTPGTGESGTWTRVSGLSPTIVSPNSATTNITGLTEGTVTLRWTVSQGACSANDEIIVTTTNVTASVGLDQNLCNATSTSVTGTTPGTGESGTWTRVSGLNPTIVSPNSSTTNITGLTEGTVTLRWTISQNSCSANDDIIINVTNVTATASSDQNICNATTASVTGTTPGTGETGTWARVSGLNPTIVSPNNATTNITGLSEGSVTLSWTITQGSCSASDEVTINVTTVATTASTDQNLCNQTSANISATALGTGESGTWTRVSGLNPTITDPTNASTSVTGLSEGSVTLKWTVTQGSCSAEDDVIINVTTVAATAGSDQNLCNQTSATLSGSVLSAGETGTWTRISGLNPTITNPNDPLTTVTGLSEGTVTLRWTVSQGSCSANEEVDVTITTVSADAGNNQTLCNQSSASINATAPGASETGVWSITGGSMTPSITNVNNASTTLTGLAVGDVILRWTVSQGSCSAYEEITITNNNGLTPDAGPTQIVCTPGTTTTLAGTAPVSGQSGTWSITGGTITPSVTNVNAYNSGVTGLSVGTVTLRWTLTDGTCTGFDDVTITISNPPTATASATPTTVCSASGVAVLDGNQPGSGQVGTWTRVTGTINPTIVDPLAYNSQVTGLTAGTVTLRWTVVQDGVCEASDEVEITVVDQPSISVAGDNQEVCNQSSVTLSATSPTSGTGTWSVVSGPGSVVDVTNPNSVLNLTGVGEVVLQWEVTSSPCAASTDLVSIINRATPSDPNAGSDQTVCDQTSVVLSADAPTSGTGTWVVVSGPGSLVDAANPNTTLNLSGPGVVTVRWEITNSPCVAKTQEITITNSDTPSDSDPGDDHLVCSQQSVTLNAVPPVSGTGTWVYVSGPGSVVDANDPSSVCNLSGTGEVILKWVVSNSPCTAKESQVTISNKAEVEATVSAGQNLCDATSTNVSATLSEGTGLWTLTSGSATIADPTNASTSVTSLGTGTIVLTWTVSNAPCASDDATVTIVNSAQPTVTDAGSDQPICADNATLTADAPATGTGSWHVVSGTGTITDASNRNTTVTGIGLGELVLEWRISSGACTPASDEVKIIRNPVTPVAAIVTEDRNLCNGLLNIDLEANTSGDPSIVGTWSVMTGSATITGLNDPTTSASGFASGTNIIRWTLNGPCGNAFDELSVTIGASNLAITANADSDTLCAGSPANLSVSVTGSTASPFTFTWVSSDGSYNQVTQNADVTVTPTDLGWVKYVVTVVDANGCSSNNMGEDSLFAVGPQDLRVPNLITPNFDDKNDCFIVKDVNNVPIMPGAAFDLYNRWGQRVYYDNDLRSGEFCGGGLADGMYFYLITTGCGSDEIKGWLHIISSEEEAANK